MSPPGSMTTCRPSSSGPAPADRHPDARTSTPGRTERRSAGRRREPRGGSDRRVDGASVVGRDHVVVRRPAPPGVHRRASTDAPAAGVVVLAAAVRTRDRHRLDLTESRRRSHTRSIPGSWRPRASTPRSPGDLGPAVGDAETGAVDHDERRDDPDDGDHPRPRARESSRGPACTSREAAPRRRQAARTGRHRRGSARPDRRPAQVPTVRRR